jgi:hypothetical protein
MNGIQYLSIGPNFGHRIGHLTEELGDRPFYWESPSGKERVLTWVSSGGYSWFHTGLGYEEITRILDDESVFRYVDQLNEAGYPYEITALRYNIGSDNGPPDPGLSGAVASWNERYASPRVVISGATRFFREFEARHGNELPTLRGDLTGHWEDGAASSARETALVRRTAEELVQAEALATLLGAPLTRDRLDEAWRNVVLFYEHTWGSWNSVSEPYSELTLAQWERKKAFADSATAQGRRLFLEATAVAGAVRSGEGQVSEVDQETGMVEVVNTLNWPRTDLVTLDAGVSRSGDQVRDESGALAPSQRLSTGELAFLTRDVPALGSRRYRVERGGTSGGEAPEGAADAFRRAGPPPGGADSTAFMVVTSELELTMDPGSGLVGSLIHRGTGRDLVSGSATVGLDDGATGLNEYLFVPGRYPDSVLRAELQAISWKEQGPLVFLMEARSEAPGAQGPLVSEVRIVEGLERVDVTNTLDKELNLDPEAVFFRFPLALADPEVRIDVPWGSFRPELGQLQGASKNYFSLQRWVDLHDDRGGATVVSIDAPMIQLGEIRTDAFVTEWLDTAEPSGTLFSYVMNNYWETNYRAGQEGVHRFTYSIRPHGGFDEAEAERFALERAQPLVALTGSPEGNPIELPFQVLAGRAVVTALKPALEGEGFLIRLYNPGTEEDQVRVEGKDGRSVRVFRSNLDEDLLAELEGPVTLGAYEIVTLLVRIR